MFINIMYYHENFMVEVGILEFLGLIGLLVGAGIGIGKFIFKHETKSKNTDTRISKLESELKSLKKKQSKNSQFIAQFRDRLKNTKVWERCPELFDDRFLNQILDEWLSSKEKTRKTNKGKK